MTPDAAAELALALYLLGCAVTFGWRSWHQRRVTGSAGFQGISGAPGSAGWWGGVLFIVALVAGALAPTITLIGGPLGARLPTPAWAAVLGTTAALLGFGGVVVSQGAMGRSWRVGVDPKERTDLVTSGLFGVVRNPIFTAMVAALAGITVMVPSPLSALALSALVVAVQLQVRVVEEPYLLTVHGSAYATYAARVGRFVPHVGRIRTARLKEIPA